MQFVVALYHERPLDPQSVRALYDVEQWWPDRTLEEIGSVVEQGIAIGAWAEQQLIGFARAVTDGLYRAYIEDVFVSTLTTVTRGSLWKC